MASVNQATIIGFVGDEPRINTAQNGNGRMIASLSVATTEKGYTKQDGTQVPDRTEWHNIVLFGKLAEVTKNYIHKGSSIYIQGKLRTRAYDDKNGIKRYTTEIVADTMQMLDRKTENSSTGLNNPSMTQQPGFPPPPNAEDEDLPF